MKILIDSREQNPFSFTGEIYQPLEFEVTGLPVGDYSLAGLSDKISIERKQLNDLTQCLGRERERFERELQKARGYDVFCVVIEASWEALAKGDYRSKLNPHAACQSIAAFTARYGIPFLFAGTRKGAEYICWSILRQYLESAKKRWKQIATAHCA